jgi:hypothetical protein
VTGSEHDIEKGEGRFGRQSYLIVNEELLGQVGLTPREIGLDVLGGTFKRSSEGSHDESRCILNRCYWWRKTPCRDTRTDIQG